MAPKGKGQGKGKGKEQGQGKAKGRESGTSSSQKQDGVRATHTFNIVLDDLGATYESAMEAIPKALRRLLIRLAPKKKKTKTRLRRVHKKLYTLNEGTFLICIMQTKNSPPETHLTLLFRWFDLYYVAYHCKAVWYRFRDDQRDKLPLPPRSQLFYKSEKNRGVVDLPYGTSYDQLGGKSVYLGPQSFQMFYDALMQTDELNKHHCLDKLFRLCQMSLPAVAFSEASRFQELLEWVSTQTALGADNKGEEATPKEYSQHFNSWGSDSRDLFDKVDGVAPGMAARFSILKTPIGRHIPLIRGPHEKGSTSSEECSSSSSSSGNED